MDNNSASMYKIIDTIIRMEIEMSIEGYDNGRDREPFSIIRTIEENGVVKDFYNGYVDGDGFDPHLSHKTKTNIIRKYRNIIDEVQDEFYDNYIEKVRQCFTETNRMEMCYMDTKVKDNEILNFYITFSNITPELNNEINK